MLEWARATEAALWVRRRAARCAATSADVDAIDVTAAGRPARRSWYAARSRR